MLTYPESRSPSSLADFGANLRTFIAASVPRKTYIGSGGLLFAIILACFRSTCACTAANATASLASQRLFSPRRYLLNRGGLVIVLKLHRWLKHFLLLAQPKWRPW